MRRLRPSRTEYWPGGRGPQGQATARRASRGARRRAPEPSRDEEAAFLDRTMKLNRLPRIVH